MKAQRDSRGIVLPFFNLNARRMVDGQRHAPHPHHSTPGKEKRYPLYSRLGRPQSRTGRVRKFPPSRIRSPDRPSRSEKITQECSEKYLPQLLNDKGEGGRRW